MEWMYMVVYNGEYDADQQDFAKSVRAGYKYASTLKEPVFVNVYTDYSCEYVVIYEKDSVPEGITTTQWIGYIDEDEHESGAHSLL